MCEGVFCALHGCVPDHMCVCVCVFVCCVALARAGGRFIVDVSWPLRGLLHVKVNGEDYKVILLVCLVFAPLITPASQGPSERRPAGPQADPWSGYAGATNSL